MENSPVKIEYHYHNHVDVADILSQLHLLKLQNHKILRLLSEQDDEEREQIMRKLKKLLADLKKTV